MQLHQIKPKNKRKKARRIGRGGKRGTYSGRGVKGQKSRSGRRLAPFIRELVKRYPKLRGYRFKGRQLKVAVINLDVLDKIFKAEEIISPRILLGKGLIRRIKGRIPKVKILGKGDVKKRFVIDGCFLSDQAREKIKKAGGSIIDIKPKIRQ